MIHKNTSKKEKPTPFYPYHPREREKKPPKEKLEIKRNSTSHTQIKKNTKRHYPRAARSAVIGRRGTPMGGPTRAGCQRNGREGLRPPTSQWEGGGLKRCMSAGKWGKGKMLCAYTPRSTSALSTPFVPLQFQPFHLPNEWVRYRKGYGGTRADTVNAPIPGFFFYVCKRVKERVFWGVLLFLKTATGLWAIVGFESCASLATLYSPWPSIFWRSMYDVIFFF